MVELDFKQEKKHLIILDTLTHKYFVSNMIGRAL